MNSTKYKPTKESRVWSDPMPCRKRSHLWQEKHQPQIVGCWLPYNNNNNNNNNNIGGGIITTQ